MVRLRPAGFGGHAGVVFDAGVAGQRMDVRGEMAALRTELAKQGGELRAEIYGATRQMYIALLLQAGLLFAFFCFFVLLLR